uniref:non-specific serine/threonine protein kinase n=1 Tax=Homo sapiens TaxID=9606 RepID=A0AAQ5BI73_HUMAN
MSRRRFDCRSISGLLTTTPQIPIKMENFNNFYILTSKELGRGKFAVVRQCISKSTGQEYAAKFLKKRRRGQDCRAEILHEIAVLELAKSCPRVINLHEVYENTSEIILILEYNDKIHRKDLRHFMDGPCSYSGKLTQCCRWRNFQPVFT